MDSEEKKPRDTTRARVAHPVNLDRIQRRLQTALSRDTGHILALSHAGKLDKQASDSLVQYLKLIKQLKKMEQEESEAMSDEQLAELASQE